MATATKLGRRGKPELIASQQFAQVFQAYLECSNEVQAAITEMAGIVNDPRATREEVESAVSTMAEALFPSCHNGKLGVDLEYCDEASNALGTEADILRSLDEQETAFGDRVNALLNAKRMTQGDLAAALGIGQPAVSMMLSRGCRPQRRTVERIAAALDVRAEEIWPELQE